MKIYATTDRGERFLAYIECDHSSCEDRIKPHPDIAKAGWAKSGIYMGIGSDHVDLGERCPDHEGAS